MRQHLKLERIFKPMGCRKGTYDDSQTWCCRASQRGRKGGVSADASALPSTFSATSVALTKHESACSFYSILDFVHWIVIPLQTWFCSRSANKERFSRSAWLAILFIG
jgi:hypothetical protein